MWSFWRCTHPQCSRAHKWHNQFHSRDHPIHRGIHCAVRLSPLRPTAQRLARARTHSCLAIRQTTHIRTRDTRGGRQARWVPSACLPPTPSDPAGAWHARLSICHAHTYAPHCRKRTPRRQSGDYLPAAEAGVGQSGTDTHRPNRPGRGECDTTNRTLWHVRGSTGTGAGTPPSSLVWAE